MARLLVEIDEELKKDLKVRLIREGVTLKDWVAGMAAKYVSGQVPSSKSEAPPATRGVSAATNGKSRHDDYLD